MISQNLQSSWENRHNTRNKNKAWVMREDALESTGMHNFVWRVGTRSWRLGALRGESATGRWGMDMGGQHVAGKETACTKPSEREGMCWKGKISEGQRDWQKGGLRLQLNCKGPVPTMLKFLFGFYLKVNGKLFKSLYWMEGRQQNPIWLQYDRDE